MMIAIIYLSMAVQLRKWSILNTLVLFLATVSNGMNTVLISTVSYALDFMLFQSLDTSSPASYSRSILSKL